jgi:hypothetical protein
MFIMLWTVVSFARVVPAQDCPQLLGSAAAQGQAWGIAVSGNYAFLADTTGGLRIFNVSGPSAPVEVSYYMGPDSVYGVAVSGQYAYLADNMAGLRVLDVSNPAAPVEIGSLVMPGNAHVYYVTIEGHYAYLTGTSTTFYIVDISNPAAPALSGSLVTSSPTYGIAAKDHYLYLANYDSGIKILDASNPAAPTVVGTYDISGLARGIAASGNILCVTDWEGALIILDITSPIFPVELARVSPFVMPTQVAISGNLALVTEFAAHLSVYDISNPASPIQVGLAATDYSMDLALSGTRAFVADGNSGMKIFDFGACLSPSGLEYIIPAAARIAGASGSNWATDAVLHNPGTASISANLYFLQSGQDNAGAAPRPVTVNPGASLKIHDVVGSLLGLSSASGAIRVVASAALMIGSRTYNDQGASGTYGQSIDGIQTTNAFGVLNQPRLIQLVRNAAYRTNLGFVNVLASPLALSVHVYAGTDGAPIGSWSRTLQPYEHYQENNILQELAAGEVEDAYAVITTSTETGRYFAYASVVDNRTGDPMFIAAR